MKKDQDFAFKDLLVWQKAMDFADSVLSVIETLPAPPSVAKGLPKAMLDLPPSTSFSDGQA